MTKRYYTETIRHIWDGTNCWATVGPHTDSDGPALFIHPDGSTDEMDMFLILDDELIDALCEALQASKTGRVTP